MPEVVVFDLDGTLIRSDSMLGFVTGRMLRRPFLGVIVSPIAALLFWRLRTRPVGLSIWVWAATVFTTEQQRARHAARFASRHLRGRGRPIEAALTELREHCRAGRQVVVATGCEEHIAQALCRALGLDEVAVVGTILRAAYGGLVVRTYCNRGTKMELLRERGFEPPYQAAYTDAAADLPLLRTAEQRIMVHPSRENLKRVRKEFPEIRVLVS
ncbi:HAD family hydrolase [Acrocarpospora macrocephala]|uniref:Haloacid dehalogenase n=1 Tax=Acrocarpospora macrocephala TaxID=150177 RepID=A0A5M3XBJ1_9ACTN|nr:haloacid dehalogenase-like hydrolase [Acrocarpospora macrocephala]GES16263.1 hypothetical protein Amac_098610 [Acrocarpospora macrocephala]